ncbi:MAG: ribonuclease R [Bacilli bacterium]|nr:ribonuclease R [Bacilli bacterium]
MQNPNYKRMTVSEIAEVLGYNDSASFKELAKTIVSLEEEYYIYRDKQDRYDLIERFGFKPGVIQITKKGFGFVTLLHEDTDDIYIPKNDLNGAMNQDTVLVVIHKGTSGASPEGEIYKVVKRGSHHLIGIYYEHNNVGYLKTDDQHFHAQVMINKNNARGAMPNHVVKVEIIKYLSDNLVEGKVSEILGHKNDPGIDILAVAHKYNLRTTFPEEVMNHAAMINDVVTDADLVGRRDLRNEIIVTIDGEDAKDLDDAVTVRKLDNGNYLLGVHIADVSYYVKENDPIDIEAFKRGTSVYLVDRVIPMIPHRLSNGICSLNPHVDRLVISCEMEINTDGEVVKYEIFPAVINSKARMTYTNVNKILVDNDEDVKKEYEELVPLFQVMAELFHILNNKRKKRGAINFDSPEAKIIVDEKGKPLEVQLRTRDIAEQIIEEFMLCANETVAEHFHWLNYPFLYRVHEDPNPDKIKRFFRLCEALGYKIKGKENVVHPKAFQELLELVANTKEEAVINTMLIRSMAKARYSEQSLGHYGLATEYYTHFTSPIRRYPDTIVHRLIREFLFESKCDEENFAKYAGLLRDIAEQTSRCERIAEDCEREVEAMKKAEYMEEHINEEFDGIISSVTNWGLYVELPNSIEGLVHVLDMTDDYYNFDERTMSLIGERTKRIYRLGDEVRVRVIGASKETREIDFEIVGIKGRKRKKTVVEIDDKPQNGKRKHKSKKGKKVNKK